MTIQQILEFLNETPYYYHNSLGAGSIFKEKIGKVKICTKRDKKAGGIEVACGDEKFHFHWDSEAGKWGLGKPIMVRG